MLKCMFQIKFNVTLTGQVGPLNPSSNTQQLPNSPLSLFHQKEGFCFPAPRRFSSDRQNIYDISGCIDSADDVMKAGGMKVIDTLAAPEFHVFPTAFHHPPF